MSQQFIGIQTQCSHSSILDMYLMKQGSIVLRSLLFDFSASIVERTIRLLDTKVDYKELIPIVRTLMARYPYEHQKR
jgi:hypothetical protein